MVRRQGGQQRTAPQQELGHDKVLRAAAACAQAFHSLSVRLIQKKARQGTSKALGSLPRTTALLLPPPRTHERARLRHGSSRLVGIAAAGLWALQQQACGHCRLIGVAATGLSAWQLQASAWQQQACGHGSSRLVGMAAAGLSAWQLQACQHGSSRLASTEWQQQACLYRATLCGTAAATALWPIQCTLVLTEHTSQCHGLHSAAQQLCAAAYLTTSPPPHTFSTAAEHP
eukprot:145772-Chlamydomonas_euryale.AAC.1